MRWQQLHHRISGETDERLIHREAGLAVPTQQRG